jgi:hypothetical protein
MANDSAKKTGGKLSIKANPVMRDGVLEEQRTVTGSSSDGFPIRLEVTQETGASANNSTLTGQAHVILRVPGADGFQYYISSSDTAGIQVGAMPKDDSAPASSQLANNRYGANMQRPNQANMGSETVHLGLDEQLKKAALTTTIGRVNGANIPTSDFDALAKIAREALAAVNVTPALVKGKGV